MLVSIMSVVVCLILAGFGSWCIIEGARVIADEPKKKSTVRTNQVFLVLGGGLIGWMAFILLAVALFPHAPMMPWAPAVLFAMPFAPSIGAIIAMLVKKFTSSK